MYRAVGDRCAVDIKDLHLPVSDAEAMRILCKAGFKPIEVDIVAIGREFIGAEYRRGARLSEAPMVFDCSSFTKYLYGQRGIWLPRRSIQQRGGELVDLETAIAGDLIFCSGRIDYYDDDPANGVGHVGLATGEGTVLHAANRRAGVVESNIDRFLGRQQDFRDVRRVIPADSQVVTMQTPEKREVETSDDMRWIVFQNLP